MEPLNVPLSLLPPEPIEVELPKVMVFDKVLVPTVLNESAPAPAMPAPLSVIVLVLVSVRPVPKAALNSAPLVTVVPVVLPNAPTESKDKVPALTDVLPE